MRLEIVVPQTTVTVAPGAETRVRIQVANHGDDAVPVRIGVARGRVAAWTQAEPAVISAGTGESTGVDLVFRPPATARPASTLQPFTVQAEDIRDGAVVARATGLVAVAAPDRVTADLTVERVRRRRTVVRVTVTNAGDASTTLGVRPTIESVGDGTDGRPDGRPLDRAARKAARKAAKRVTARPSVLDVPAGQSAEARVTARPKRALIGARTPYVLSVKCFDVADETASALAPDTGDEPPAPLATVTHAGTARPKLSRPTATITGLLLVAALTAGGVYVSRLDGFSLSDQLGRLTPQGRAEQRTEPDTVRRPYVLLDVFSRNDGPDGRVAAEATRERLNSAGMRVRIVDSMASTELADGQDGTGFWVVLRDGFRSLDEARAYCQQYRVVAPNCQVVP